MKPRHNNLERVGLHFVAQIIEGNYNWIFREQSVADVGIDAVVEHCVDSTPTGKLLALQIKSGEGNLKKTQKGYTYYISNTHYYYWINYQLPLILTCYIKDKKKKVYWVEISKSNVKPTKTRWKVEIPKTQILNDNSFSAIERIIKNGNKIILQSSSKQKQIAEKEIFKISAMSPMNISLKFLVDYSSKLTENMQELTRRAEAIKTITDDNQQSIEFLKLTHELDYVMSGFATRVSAEIKTYAKLYSDLLSGIQSKHTIISTYTDDQDEKTKDILGIETLKKAINEAANGIQYLSNSLSSIRDLEILDVKSEITLAILATDQVINEMKISIELADELILAIRKDYK